MEKSYGRDVDDYNYYDRQNYNEYDTVRINHTYSIKKKYVNTQFPWPVLIISIIGLIIVIYTCFAPNLTNGVAFYIITFSSLWFLSWTFLLYLLWVNFFITESWILLIIPVVLLLILVILVVIFRINQN